LSKLKLGDGLALPLDIAGQTVALVGIRGSGKTNTAGVIAEELLDRHQPIVVLDPTDAWWGLRSKYPVFIFGGPKGDLPLQETDGKALAEFVVQEQVPLILSLRHLRKAAQRRLVTDFCEELYHLKGKTEYRSPLTVFIDEAPLFVPQRVMGEVARTVGAVEDLIARGRNSGFGVVLISQRSATLNKDVLTQADTIIAHRLPSPQDRKALGEWIEENASIEEYKAVLSSLPKLKTGEAWVWAPRLDIFRSVQIRPRHTFDSSAAPKVGETITPPKALAEIDLDKLRGKLAAAVEKAKADDPKTLRQRIAALEKELAAKPKAVTEQKTVERFVLKDGQLARAEKLIAQLAPIVHEISGAIERTRETTTATVLPSRLPDRVAHPARSVSAHGRTHEPSETVRQTRRDAGVRGREHAAASSGEGLPPGEHATLTAALQYPGLDRKRLGVLTGYKRSSRDAYIVRLAARGFVTVQGQQLYPTDEGRAALNGSFEPLPTGSDLIEYWRARLPEGERRTLDVLIDTGGEDTAREVIDESTGYKRSSRDAYLVRLKARGLVEFSGRGLVRASAELFD
jgi:uncharacterized protein